MSNRILHICNEEGINLDGEALSTLSSISQGDLRRAITYLQSGARLFGSTITSTDLLNVSGVVPLEVVKRFFTACKSADFDIANKEVDNIVAEGYPASQIINQLFDIVVEAGDDITDNQKAKICKCLAETDKFIQMVDDGEGYFKRPGAVPFSWEIRPGISKTGNPQPDDDDPTLLPPLRLKQLPPSNPPSPSSSKSREISPFAPPPCSFRLKPPAADSDHHSSGPPTPYWRCSSARDSLDSGASLSRWHLLKSLIGLKKSKSRGVDSTSSESDIFYESPSKGSSRGSATKSWSSPQSSLSSSRTLKRNKSDLSYSEKKTILIMAQHFF